jgi:hypothetical protein
MDCLDDQLFDCLKTRQRSSFENSIFTLHYLRLSNIAEANPALVLSGCLFTTLVCTCGNYLYTTACLGASLSLWAGTAIIPIEAFVVTAYLGN